MTTKIAFIATGRINDKSCINGIDITVKSGKDGIGGMFSPTWELVSGHKKANNPDDERWKNAKPLTDEQYTEQYTQLLRERYAQNPQAFLDLLDKGFITLQCYCGEGFCHRKLAAMILYKIGRHNGYEVTVVGEVETLDLSETIRTM